MKSAPETPIGSTDAEPSSTQNVPSSLIGQEILAPELSETQSTPVRGEEIPAPELSETPPPAAPKKTEESKNFPFRWAILGMGIVVFICGVAVYAAGRICGAFQCSPTNLSIATGNGKQIELLDSRNGVVLKLERFGNEGRVIIEQSNQKNWLFVSRDDSFVSTAALSPDASWVAYATNRDKKEIVIVELNGNAGKKIGDSDLTELGTRTNLGAIKLCGWTPIVWNARNEIAFFACGEGRTFSAAVVGDIKTNPPTVEIVPSSASFLNQERDLLWVDDSHLEITFPSDNWLSQSSSAVVGIK